ncbi:hypothetical protein ANCCAN_11754 [Ancylostoma caninum]|uniref:Uncharacterized protein n=1 Tax=Ancylostoma caninum TaxID=29170 RepID=A0A368GG86_ANCCA|nr:hypothetical protein ANCCAN_11754 [Ancylostoma caninum]
MSPTFLTPVKQKKSSVASHRSNFRYHHRNVSLMSPTAEKQAENPLESNRSKYCYRRRNVSSMSPTTEELTKSPEEHRSSYRYNHGNLSPVNLG